MFYPLFEILDLVYQISIEQKSIQTGYHAFGSRERDNKRPITKDVRGA